jgi:hypothetical protein
MRNVPPTCTFESKDFKALIAVSIEPLHTTSPCDAPEPVDGASSAVYTTLLSEGGLESAAVWLMGGGTARLALVVPLAVDRDRSKCFPSRVRAFLNGRWGSSALLLVIPSSLTTTFAKAQCQSDFAEHS